MISKDLRKLKTKRINIFVSLLLILLAVLSFIWSDSILLLKDREVWPDEAVYMDMALNILNKGHLATNLYNGAIPGSQEHALWYPPLYFYVLAGWTRILGPGIEAVRLLSVGLGLVSLVLVFIIADLLYKNKLLAFIGTFLVSIDLSFMRSSRVARMEMLCFLFILSAVISYLLAERNKSKRLYVLSGIFAVLAPLTHPLGYIVAAILIPYIFLTNRKIKQSLRIIKYILIPFLVGHLIWFGSMLGSFGLYLTQFKIVMARKLQPATPYPVVLYHQSVSFKQLFQIFIIIGIILLTVFVFYRKRRDLLVLLGLLVSVIFVMQGKELWYTIYFQPFISLAVLSIIKTVSENFRKWIGILIGIFIITVLLRINYTLDRSVIDVFSGDKFDYHYFTQKVRAALPNKGAVFLAVIPDPYFDLRENPGLALYEIPEVPLSDIRYKILLNSSDYIVINISNDKFLNNYIAKNTREVTDIFENGQYGTKVIELVPREERI